MEFVSNFEWNVLKYHRKFQELIHVRNIFMSAYTAVCLNFDSDYLRKVLDGESAMLGRNYGVVATLIMMLYVID